MDKYYERGLTEKFLQIRPVIRILTPWLSCTFSVIHQDEIFEKGFELMQRMLPSVQTAYQVELAVMLTLLGVLV